MPNPRIPDGAESDSDFSDWSFILPTITDRENESSDNSEF